MFADINKNNSSEKDFSSISSDSSDNDSINNNSYDDDNTLDYFNNNRNIEFGDAIN